jgi:hypothetical protein
MKAVLVLMNRRYDNGAPAEKTASISVFTRGCILERSPATISIGYVSLCASCLTAEDYSKNTLTFA